MMPDQARCLPRNFQQRDEGSPSLTRSRRDAVAPRTFLLLAVFLLCAAHCFAHPMGNFSVNHYSRISLERDAVKVTYILDLAEIPTFQELQKQNISADATDPAVKRFVSGRGTEFGRGLRLTIDGKPVDLHLVSSQVIFPPGAGGLPTLKMGFVYRATVDHSAGSLQYEDNNYPGHSGWKEIVTAAPAAHLIYSSAPQHDRSAALTNYPTDLLNSPPQDLSASIQFHYAVLPKATEHRDAAAPMTAAPIAAPVVATAAPLQLQANRNTTPRSAFTQLITGQKISPWFLLTAAMIALGLGGLHALEPGHGKTIVAAYLVGSRGTARHAVLLGLIVTLSHTAGVFALGAITLYASRSIVPEQLYPWLGVFSGVIITALGGYMLLRRWSGLDVTHTHANGVMHGQSLSASQEPAQRAISLYQLFALGITGGIIPCPAALVVLLSAFALHRVGLGFFLIVAFSLGLAAVLIGVGLLMVYARRFMTRWKADGPLTTRWLPVASAGFMTALGVAMSAQAFATTGLGMHSLSRERLGPFLLIAGLGLLLGMRHSTDADHVVAVSTIISKQNSIRQAGLIGSIWGLGHTLTIFAVGSLIILFGVVIPPRLGLSMEFSVALMLILLGVLNLTGVMQRITSYFSRKPAESRPVETFLDRSVGRFGLYQCLRPLIVGIVHGLAGSAAVALLVLSTIHNPYWATVYLLVFGAGTVVGMMFMTAAMAVPLAYAGKRFAGMSRFFTLASGVVSVCFGCFLVYQLGFLGGLFTSHPHWTPQ